MAYGGNYRFTGKSEEKYGAGAPNILYVGCATDADAITLAGAIEGLFSLQIATVDAETLGAATLPYPAGTENVFRCALRDENGALEIQWLYNVKEVSDGGLDWKAFGAAVVGSGQLIKSTGLAVTSCVVAPFYTNNPNF